MKYHFMVYEKSNAESFDFRIFELFFPPSFGADFKIKIMKKNFKVKCLSDHYFFLKGILFG
jgi:hypothetical protein